VTGDTPFVLFGTAHLLTILLIALSSAVLPWIVHRAGPAVPERAIARSLAILLVAHELFKIWMRMAVYGQSPGEALPLHLCNVAAFLIAYVLVWSRYRAFEVAYFWGMAGTVRAILTPDLPFGFPSLSYVTFFIGHGLVIVGVLYAVVVMGLRPTLASVGRAVLATLAYAALITPLNMALGANYLYLRHKPEGASLMDYFGPWPWYLFVLLGVGAVTFMLCYAPFAVIEHRAKLRHSG
jgi:hypothetical integral membrane protein (TIGR02206 family)